jgi:hypothetical protein
MLSALMPTTMKDESYTRLPLRSAAISPKTVSRSSALGGRTPTALRFRRQIRLRCDNLNMPGARLASEPLIQCFRAVMQLKVRVCLNKLSNGKIQITCLKPALGGAGHARPYETEADAKNVLLAFGLDPEHADAYLATLREIDAMELMSLGEYDVSDDTLRANGFTAV